MGLMPASYKVTARSVSRVLGDGRRQSDRSLKGHAAGVRKGQPWAVNHHPGIVAVYGQFKSRLPDQKLVAVTSTSRRSSRVRPQILGPDGSRSALRQRDLNSGMSPGPN